MEVAKKAAKATTIGKIVLPIAAAGVAGATYLKNKLKKEDKKMVGGMAKKYSDGAGSQGVKIYDAVIMDADGKLKKIKKRVSETGQVEMYESGETRGPGKLPKKIGRSGLLGGSRMGGGMIQKPMGYKSGNEVRKDIKLGRALVEAFGSKKTINKMKANIQDQNRVKKYSVGGGADMGAKRDFDKTPERTKTYALAERMKDRNRDIDFAKGRRSRPAYALAESMKDRDRLTERDIQEATKALKPSQRKSRRYAATPGYLPKPAIGKMGGGMMNKPMGYKSGTMVKARGCKLGRTRPTKMY